MSYLNARYLSQACESSSNRRKNHSNQRIEMFAAMHPTTTCSRSKKFPKIQPKLLISNLFYQTLKCPVVDQNTERAEHDLDIAL